MLLVSIKLSRLSVQVIIFTPPLQKDKVVKDKKEDKKNKGKAKESTEPEANEENHSENGEAKSNAVHFAHSFYLLRV